MDTAIGEIKAIQEKARTEGYSGRPQWPMIVMKTPKGWTGPKDVDGKKTEDYWRSHQVPLSEMASKPGHVQLLEDWMKSYKPEELFDEKGRKLRIIGDRTKSHFRKWLLSRDTSNSSRIG